MDTFHTKIRLIITQSWQSSATRDKFRGFQSAESLAPVLGMPVAEVETMLDQGVWGCGDSANRLCELLAGETLGDGNGWADITNDGEMTKIYLDIAKGKSPVLVRINVQGEGVGHAYVFVSKLEGNPLDGYIYQTNVGVKNREYDLLEWIRDAKSAQMVYLPGHLAELAGRFLGSFAGSVVDRVSVYTDQYLRTGDTLPDTTSGAEKSPRQKVQDAKSRIIVRWKALDVTSAYGRLDGAIA
jgi:hypothetical protein